MRQRRDMREAYQRVMPKTWESFDSTDTTLIKSAIKGVWRKLTGKPCPMEVVVNPRVRHAWRHYESGHRRGRVYVDGRYVIAFNPKRGLQSAVHSVTHFIHGRLFPNDKPHSDRHLEMERAAAEYVVKRFNKG